MLIKIELVHQEKTNKDKIAQEVISKQEEKIKEMKAEKVCYLEKVFAAKINCIKL